MDELSEDSLEELKARRAEARSGSIDVDETELAESLELPGADLSSLSGEELTVRVLPKQDDEFTCSVCFLVHHRSRLRARAQRAVHLQGLRPESAPIGGSLRNGGRRISGAHRRSTCTSACQRLAARVRR